MENGANVFEESAKGKTGQDSGSEKMGPLERKIGQLTMELDFAKKVLLGIQSVAPKPNTSVPARDNKKFPYLLKVALHLQTKSGVGD